MGITSLFPVQVAVWQETIGPGSFERDLCINSPTGSGKTLSYALLIVQMLSTRAIRYLRALVMLPTRDLALQVTHNFFVPVSLILDCYMLDALTGSTVPLKDTTSWGGWLELGLGRCCQGPKSPKL